MQAYLIDTSVLVRFLNEDDSLHKEISLAVDRVFGDGGAICFTPQVARETWSVLTRPRDVGGFGLTPSETSRLIDTAHKAFDYVADTSAIYDRWRMLVVSHQVSGKQAHDAYHVAAMLTHGFSRVLTLDQRDFKRYSEITALKPSEV